MKFMELLQKFAPLKCKYIRVDFSKFRKEELTKVIMLRRKKKRHQKHLTIKETYASD